METAKTKLESGNIPRQTLVSFVRDLFGGYPNPDDPQPPGPWDPVIRVAIRKAVNAMEPLGSGKHLTGLYPFDDYYYENPPKPNWSLLLRIIADRHPAIWDIIGGGPLSMVALNPQPLPPGILFAASVAGEVIKDAVARQELADIFRPNGEEAGIIIVGGRVGHFVDDWCGTMWKLRWPFPGPRPNWFKEKLTGTDLVVMGVQFENAAGQVFNTALSQAFRDAGAKFIETGLSRMQ